MSLIACALDHGAARNASRISSAPADPCGCNAALCRGRADAGTGRAAWAFCRDGAGAAALPEDAAAAAGARHRSVACARRRRGGAPPARA
jgi:hypothetical protein